MSSALAGGGSKLSRFVRLPSLSPCCFEPEAGAGVRSFSQGTTPCPLPPQVLLGEPPAKVLRWVQGARAGRRPGPGRPAAAVSRGTREAAAGGASRSVAREGTAACAGSEAALPSPL